MLKVYSRNLGDVAVLSLQGRLINGETRNLREAVRSQSNVSAIVLDLSRLTAIDARGLGVMLELRNEALARGTRFKLMNVSGFQYRVFQLTRLDTVFDIVSRSEADGASVMRETTPARSVITRVPVAACA